MRVLVVHNAYQLAGGEDAVVLNEVALLREHGNTVQLHLVSNDGVTGLLGKLRAAIGVIFSFSSYFKIRQILRNFRPSIVHVHNFFPLVSPAVFYACKAEGVPVVMTLHNFRLICPTAVLMYDGKITERSLRDGPWWGVRARVYRGSLLGSFVLASMIAVHQGIGTWRKQVDRFIVLSNFSVNKFSQGGLPIDKLVVKPNFVNVTAPVEIDRCGFLFVGRLSPEKGVNILLAAVGLLNESPIYICVAGTGPLAHSVKKAGPAVEPLGAISSSAVQERMTRSTALVIPSICYEGFPMVLVEAYACGLPVIASRIGALAELVEDGVTGLLFEPGDAKDLAEKLEWASHHPQQMAEMGVAARARYLERYTPGKNYEQLMLIYRAAIEAAD